MAEKFLFCAILKLVLDFLLFVGYDLGMVRVEINLITIARNATALTSLTAMRAFLMGGAIVREFNKQGDVTSCFVSPAHLIMSVLDGLLRPEPFFVE